MPLANFVSGLANAGAARLGRHGCSSLTSTPGKQMGEQLSAQVERHRNPDGTPASATTPGAPGAEAKSGGGLAGLRTTMRQGVSAPFRSFRSAPDYVSQASSS
jgi:hypothetical protein